MDEDGDYDSDSTVLITDFSEYPEKIVRKRRRLDATLRRVSQTNIHAGDAKDTAPSTPGGAVPRNGKSARDTATEQWRINNFLDKYEPDNNDGNDIVSEDVRIKEELLKQENESDPRISDGEGNDGKEVDDICIVISDDSDDDGTVVNTELNRQVDKNTNLSSRISVLTPSAINTRRATIDSFESNERASNNDPVKSSQPNKVNPLLTVLKPSAINARRATINCFIRNDHTGKNVDNSTNRPVDFSNNETKNKESNDNKTKENVNKKVIETNRLSGHKVASEPLPKLTTFDQNEISRKRKSSVVQGKPGDLQIRRIISSPKDTDDNAGVIKIVRPNQSTSCSNVVHSTAEVLSRNVQKMGGIQEKVNTGTVNSNDSNKIDVDRHTTTKINTVNDICKRVTVTKENNVISRGSSDVNNTEDTTNYVKGQTINSVGRAVNTDVFDSSKKENENLPKINKSTGAVDKNTLNSISFSCAVINNTNSVESPFLQNLKNIMNNKIVHQKEDSSALDESTEVNERLSTVSKSYDAQRVRTDLQTGNNDAVINTNSSGNPVMEILKGMIIGSKVQETETIENKKINENVNEASDEGSSHGVDRGPQRVRTNIHTGNTDVVININSSKTPVMEVLKNMIIGNKVQETETIEQKKSNENVNEASDEGSSHGVDRGPQRVRTDIHTGNHDAVTNINSSKTPVMEVLKNIIIGNKVQETETIEKKKSNENINEASDEGSSHGVDRGPQRVRTDIHTGNHDAVTNINSSKTPVMEVLKNIIIGNKVQETETIEKKKSNENINEVNEEESSHGVDRGPQQVRTDIHTGNNDAVTNINSSKTPVMEVLKNIIIGNKVQETETIEKKKSNENINEVNEEESSHGVDRGPQRVRTDIHTGNNDAVTNINISGNPIMEILKGMIIESKVQETETVKKKKNNENVNEVNDEGSSHGVDRGPRVRTDIHTGNNDAVINTNNSGNPVMEILKGMIIGNKVQETETIENKKSSHEVDRGQEKNLNKIDEAGPRKEIRHIAPDEHVTEFQVGFFKDVKQYLKLILRESKKLNSFRASPDVLKREIKHMTNVAKTHGPSEIQYACPRCSQVSVYSPTVMYQIVNGNNTIPENNTLKCKLCRGLQTLHAANMQVYAKLKKYKNQYEINAAPKSRLDNISNQPTTGGNDNVAINNNIPNPDPKARTSALNTTAMALINDVTTTSIEKSGQSDPIMHKRNDIASSGDKTKSYKRKVDDNRSPAGPKRVRVVTDTQDKNAKATEKNKNQTELIVTTALPSTLLNEPATSNNSGNTINSDNASTYDANESGTKNNAKIGSGDKNYTNEDKNSSKAHLTKDPVQNFTKLNNPRNAREENFIQTTNKNDNQKTSDIQHVCPVCTCVFSSPNSLLAHMKGNHNWSNIPENEITCPLRNVHSTERNHIAHGKEHYSDENSEIVDSDNTTSKCKNQNVTSADTQHHNTVKKEETPKGGKLYECKICNKVLYSSSMAKKHRNEVHGHLDLKNKKLYNVTERKPSLISSDIQSSTSVENTSSEGNNPTSEPEEEIPNQDSGSVGIGEMNSHEENGQHKTNRVDGYEKDCNNATDEINVPQNRNETYDEKTKTNHERKRKASQNTDMEVKQANVINSNEKTMYKCLICKELFTDYGSRKHREEKHPDFINRHLFDKVTITDIGYIDKEKISDERPGEKNKTHKDDQYEINLINDFLGELENENKISSSIDDVQDTTETDKATKLDKETCSSCGVNNLRDGTHECAYEITKVETVKYVFKCEDCNTATDIYDDVIRHCQNHYNNIRDTTAFCETCKLFFTTGHFETHKLLHENEIKIINYSYKSLFSNWDKIFDNIPTDVASEMQLRSIHRSRCVKMSVTVEGPWEYSLYECNQCETCVPPGKIDQHCQQKQCCFVAYPCSECEKLFPSAPIRTNHEQHHRTNKQFKIIHFNSKKDEGFNLRLFEARKLEMASRIPVADIYKCQCGVCFISDETFRKHFVSCDMQSGMGTICDLCAVPRLFEASEFDKHFCLHHRSVRYRFRVNRLVIQQEVEPFDYLKQESGGERKTERQLVCRTDDDIKRELLKQEDDGRTV